MSARTAYGYRVWPTGKKFAAHVWAPGMWERQHGFLTAKDAEWWAMDRIVEFGEAARGDVSGMTA